MKQYRFWFVTGTQELYGEEVLRQVAQDSAAIVAALNVHSAIPCTVEDKGILTGSDAIERVLLQANMEEQCAGVIGWMHTFSPAKMWIRGLARLQKPYLHFNTQFFRDIPFDKIDMDYMNLHQSAHGDREHGHILARLRLARKVIAGHWQDEKTLGRIGHWMRSMAGVWESRRLCMVRFGDNMREVAVTEGDKVEAQLRLGWSVNTFGIGDLIARVEAVSHAQEEEMLAHYRAHYDLKTENLEAVRYQARMEAALLSFLEEGGYGAFTDTFQDLQQLKELPGLAVQDLMARGYGFGGEGDWKTAALDRVMKKMGQGLAGGTGFMEDYSYHMDPQQPGILGAHMLEVDPALASDRPWIEVHPLGIGGREPPARLCFHTGDGPAILASLIDMGDRLRMIVNDIEAIRPYREMPKLPVAQVMWKPLPDLATSAEAWLMAGGAHHTVMSYQLDAEHMREFCEALQIEYIHIGRHTDLAALQKELALNDALYHWSPRG